MLKSSNAPGVAKEVLSHATLGWAGHPYPQAASGPETWLKNPREILCSLPCWCCLKVLPSEFLCVFILHIYHTFVEKREYGDRTTSSFFDSLKCISAPQIWIVQKIHEPWRLPSPQVVVHGEVYSVWSLLEASCQECKTQDPIYCVFYTNYIPMISNKLWTFVKRILSFANNTFSWSSVFKVDAAKDGMCFVEAQKACGVNKKSVTLWWCIQTFQKPCHNEVFCIIFSHFESTN